MTDARPASANRHEDLLLPAFVARLERLELHVRRLAAGERRGESPTSRRGPGLLFRGHRPYVVGDDPRFIDWHAFLRLGDLVVKEFDAEEAPRLLLCLDRSASMAAGDGGVKFAQARRLAAALGYLALARRSPVRLVPLPGDRRPRAFDGRGRLRALLAELAALEVVPRAAGLRELDRAAAERRVPGLAIVVGDFYDLEESAAALRLLRGRGATVEAIHLYLPEELDPRALGPAILRDLETGTALRARLRPEHLAEYRAVAERHFADVASACSAAGAGYHRLDARDTLERLVLTVLRARGVVR